MFVRAVNDKRLRLLSKENKNFLQKVKSPLISLMVEAKSMKSFFSLQLIKVKALEKMTLIIPTNLKK